jgi:Phage late-transcription coactivator
MTDSSEDLAELIIPKDPALVPASVKLNTDFLEDVERLVKSAGLSYMEAVMHWAERRGMTEESVAGLVKGTRSRTLKDAIQREATELRLLGLYAKPPRSKPEPEPEESPNADKLSDAEKKPKRGWSTKKSKAPTANKRLRYCEVHSVTKTAPAMSRHKKSLSGCRIINLEDNDPRALAYRNSPRKRGGRPRA